MEEIKKETVIKAYKGFNKDMTCRDFQYEEGKEYETDEAKCCITGFHACEMPLEVFRYYPPTNGNRYYEVEQSGKIDRFGDIYGDNSSKLASSKIRIGHELSVAGLIYAHSSYVKNHKNYELQACVDHFVPVVRCGKSPIAASTNPHSPSVTVGDAAIAATAGPLSPAVSCGESSISVTTSNVSPAVASGYNSLAKSESIDGCSITKGDLSTSISTGDNSIAVGSGCCAKATVTGSNSVAIAIGDEALAETGGSNSVAIAIGCPPVVKGKLGDLLVFIERDNYTGGISIVKDVKVDGRSIKPDVSYMKKNGVIKELWMVEENCQ